MTEPPRRDLRDFGFRRRQRGIGPAAFLGGVRVATGDVNRVANTANLTGFPHPTGE